MNWTNNLEEVIKNVLQIDKIVYPSEDILKKLSLSKKAFYRLCKNEKVMTAHEAVVLAEWLGVSVNSLITIHENQDSEFHKEGHQYA